ncbi:unnamed protein product [Alopecurus aequalis]
MAGEDGSRITLSLAKDERAAKDAVAAGEECLLKPKARPTKRKAEEDDEQQQRATKRKAAIGRSEAQNPCYAKPGEKLTRLPKADVRRILAYEIDADDVPPDYRAMKLRNPDLIPSPEEEQDEGTVMHYEIREQFSRFQRWVRREYDRKGYVEVDDDFLADRRRVRACCDRAREEAFESIDFSDEDEDLKMLFRKRRH